MTNRAEVYKPSENPIQQWIRWRYNGNRSGDVQINNEALAELIGVIGAPQKPLIITETPNNNNFGIETEPKRLSELFRWRDDNGATILQLDYARIDRYVLRAKPAKGYSFDQDSHRAYFVQTLASAASVGIYYWSKQEMEKKSLLKEKRKRKEFEDFWARHLEIPNQPISPLQFLSFPLIPSIA